MNRLNYEKVFKTLVEETGNYLVNHSLRAMVLGVSGGIDSTVVAAICCEVNKQTNIPLIGRSLPIKNKKDEFDVSKLVGEAFCNNFDVANLYDEYKCFLSGLVWREERIDLLDDTETMHPEKSKQQTLIANGNIQARLRMIYLYNLASIHNGLVMSTDNQTEYQLGFWTIHGDVGDFDPIQDLWKTEVYGLANYLQDHYKSKALEALRNDYKETCDNYKAMSCAIYNSCKLVPTDGLGISNSDLDQIGAKSYNDVDRVLQTLVCPASPENDRVQDALTVEIGPEIIDKIIKRRRNSRFKREKSPIYISRERYE
jgi:NAD+ synthetase